MPTTTPPEGLRYVYGLSPNDWRPGRPARNNYVAEYGALSTADIDAINLSSWAGVIFSLPTDQPTDLLARNLPDAHSAQAWREWAERMGARFELTYVPGTYNTTNGYVYAILEARTDFLTATATAEAAILANDPAGELNLRPTVLAAPLPDQFLRPVVELDNEPPTETPILMPNTSTVKAPDDHPALGRRTCSACGLMGHNVRTCTGVAGKAYDRVGIEIEGRWHNLREVRLRAVSLTDVEGYQDGSVRSGTSGAAAWEFQTRPGSISEALNQLHALYPDEADSSCGMHIHVSFAPIDLFLLANTEFFAYFRRRWQEWGTRMHIRQGTEFWKRLNGENSYCRINTDVPRDMINMDRYHQLNFSAWERHKTVECRLLPMFKHEKLALAAVQELLSIYQDWFAMDHASMFPASDVTLPGYQATPDITEYHVETPATIFSTVNLLDVVSLPPVANGLTRIAIPTGRTMDNTSVLDRLTRIAQPAGESQTA